MSSDYYMHREFLKKELDSLDYNRDIECLEFGTGDGSALIFHEYAKKYSNLSICAYETDHSWLRSTKNTYELPNYKFFHVNSWSDILHDANFTKIYDLVFVDQAPWEARIQTIDLLKEKTKVIILHDYDYYNKDICKDIYSVDETSFFNRYRKDFDIECYFENLPPTLVMKCRKFL